MPIKSSIFQNFLTNSAKLNGRYGIYAGFIASALTLPLISNKNKSSADEPNSSTTNTSQKTKAIDKRTLEESLATSVYPSIRKDLIKLYETEEKENKKIKRGEIKEEDREVKICFTSFTPPGEIANDRGNGGNLHIVKYLDIKQPNGSIFRTYVNEHWPVTDGGILPPETIRTRSQYTEGPLKEEGAEQLFNTDMLQIFWNNDANDGKGFTPKFYRQHLYGNFNPAKQINPLNQTETPISSPLSCISCHNSQATFTQSIFNTKKYNFGAITPDEEFQKPYHKQKGYIELIHYLKKLLENKKITTDFLNRIAASLLNSTNLENPNMADELKSNNSIPWVDGDVLDGDYDFRAMSYKYKDRNKTWRKADYEYFKQTTNAGYWWNKNTIIQIP